MFRVASFSHIVGHLLSDAAVAGVLGGDNNTVLAIGRGDVPDQSALVSKIYRLEMSYSVYLGSLLLALFSHFFATVCLGMSRNEFLITQKTVVRFLCSVCANLNIGQL